MSEVFLDMPSAAAFAGFSLRHFRRVVEEDQIPVITLPGRKHGKFFILRQELEKWRTDNGHKRDTTRPPKGAARIGEVAESMDCSVNTARKRLRKMGIEPVKRGHVEYWPVNV